MHLLLQQLRSSYKIKVSQGVVMETEYVKSLMTRVVSCHDRDRVLLPVRGVVLSCNCIRLGDVYIIS